jgi:CDI immunity proteins
VVQPSPEASLEQVEGQSWGDAPPDSTKLMTTVYSLRRRPIGELTAEDYRVLIAQKVGLEVLVPRTLHLLRRDRLLEGEYHPGDVLSAVLRVPAAYWARHPDQRALLEAVLADVEEPDTELAADIETFRESQPS